MYLVMAKQIYSLHTFIFYEKEGAEEKKIYAIALWRISGTAST